MLRSLISIGIVLGLVCHPALAGARKEIWLQRGVPMTLEGVVSQSEHDRYLLLASPGQTLQIKLESTTNNGVFSVFGPGYTEESDTFVSGRSSHQEVTSARVVPATSGTHLIDVGSLGGTTRYRMIVTVEGYTSDSRETTSSQNASALAQKDTPLLLKDTYVPRLLTDTWLRCGEGRSGDVTRVFLSDGTFIQTEANVSSNRSKITTVGDYVVSEQNSMQAKVTFPRDVLTSTEKSLEKKMWRFERITSSSSSAAETFWLVGEQTKPFLACAYGDKLSPTELSSVRSSIRQITSRGHLATKAETDEDRKGKVKEWLAAFIKKYGTDYETRVAAPTMAFRLRYKRALQAEPQCRMADAIAGQFETSSSRSNTSANPQIQAMLAETFLIALYGSCPKAFSDIMK